jgi:hypothetical protein
MKRTEALADLNIYLWRYFQLFFEKQDLMIQIGSMNLGKLVIVQTIRQSYAANLSTPAGRERSGFHPVIVCHILAFWNSIH